MGGLFVGEVVSVVKTVDSFVEGLLTVLVGVTAVTLLGKLFDFLAGITV